jgi:hypothetical protein
MAEVPHLFDQDLPWDVSLCDNVYNSASKQYITNTQEVAWDQASALALLSALEPAANAPDGIEELSLEFNREPGQPAVVGFGEAEVVALNRICGDSLGSLHLEGIRLEKDFFPALTKALPELEEGLCSPMASASQHAS